MNDMAREKGDMYAAFVNQGLGQGIVSMSCLRECGLMLRTELRDLLSGKTVYEPDENLDNGAADDENHPPPKASRRRKGGTTEPTGTKKKSSQKRCKPGPGPGMDTITNEENNSNMQAGQKAGEKQKNIIVPVEENSSNVRGKAQDSKEPPVEEDNYNTDLGLTSVTVQNAIDYTSSNVFVLSLHSDG
jgi:hypothetical protein